MDKTIEEIKAEIKDLEEKRKCKTCNEMKKLTEFDRSYNKNCINITYRHVCKSCLVKSRKGYMNEYYKKHYVKKERAKKYKKKQPPITHCQGCNCGNNL